MTDIPEPEPVQVYRRGRSRLLVFRDVDVTVFMEREQPGQRDRSIVTFHVVRAADSKSLLAIHNELQDARHAPDQDSAGRALMRFYEALPRVARRGLMRVARRFPEIWTRIGGTVAVTAVGMFAKDRGGWGIPQTWNTLDVTVGSIAKKPGVVDGQIAVREYLGVTVSFDHDIVDGAPAARFCERLAELLESGYGLAEVAGADALSLSAN